MGEGKAARRPSHFGQMCDSSAQQGWLQVSPRTGRGFVRPASQLPPSSAQLGAGPQQTSCPLNSTAVFASRETYLRQLVLGVVQESRWLDGAFGTALLPSQLARRTPSLVAGEAQAGPSTRLMNGWCTCGWSVQAGHECTGHLRVPVGWGVIVTLKIPVLGLPWWRSG